MFKAPVIYAGYVLLYFRNPLVSCLGFVQSISISEKNVFFFFDELDFSGQTLMSLSEARQSLFSLIQEEGVLR